MNKQVINEVVKFVVQRHGSDKEWFKKVFGLSRESIAKLYLREYVNWEDYGRKESEDGERR